MWSARIEIIAEPPADVPVKTDPHPEPVTHSGPVETTKTYEEPKGHRPVSQRRKVIGYAVGISFLIIVPIIIFGVLNNLNLNHVGDLEFNVDSFAETNIILDIDNSLGDIEIQYDQTLTNLFEADIEVWGKPNSDIADAKNFLLDNDTVGEITLSFDSGDWSFWFWRTETFRYEIVIYLHPSAEVDFDIDAGTGAILLDTNAVDYLNLNDVNLESGTGKLSVVMVNSVNISVENLNLNTGTGDVVVDLGSFTHLNTSTVLLKTGTGYIALTYEDLILYDDIVWSLDTGTGWIYINIIQNVVFPMVHETAFLAETGTGTISVDVQLNISIGIHVDADVGTGDIDIFGYDHDYESLNYATADNIYTLMLDTGTGDIVVV